MSAGEYNFVNMVVFECKTYILVVACIKRNEVMNLEDWKV